MPRPRRFKIADVEQALRNSAGNRTMAAQRLDCAITTITNYIERSPRLKAVIEEHTERITDAAETGLAQHILDGNLRAIIFHLRTKGRERGYVFRTEVQGTAEGPPVRTQDVKPDMSALSDDELRAFRELAAQAEAASRES